MQFGLRRRARGSLCWPAILLLALAAPSGRAEERPGRLVGEHLYGRDNLVAWCVVPFDAAGRGPEERAAMLAHLGIRRLAYDWRAEHLAEFEREIAALRNHDIDLEAVWLPCGLQPLDEEHVVKILETLERTGTRTQLWLSLRQGELEGLSQDEKVEVAAKAVAAVAHRAADLGCTVGLYNHGGWFGDPENQVAVLRRVDLQNVGIVYNFHHAHEQLERFPELLSLMLPHLHTVNLNGMRVGGPKILALAEGDREVEMMRRLRDSGYRGPIGILDHRQELDAETSLRQNLAGMQELLRQLDLNGALESYRHP